MDYARYTTFKSEKNPWRRYDLNFRNYGGNLILIKYIKLFVSIVFLNIINLNASNWNVATHIQTDDISEINKIQIDNNGNIIGASRYKGSTLNTTPAYTSLNNSNDILLFKLDNNLSMTWINTIGSVDNETLNSTGFDSEGNIYVLGASTGNCKFTPDDSIIYSGGSFGDIFLAKYSPDGDFIWGKNIGMGDDRQVPTDIEVDDNDNLIIVGNFVDSIDFGDTVLYANAYTTSFISKWDSSGTIIWSKRVIGTYNSNSISSVTSLNDGYYFTGYFRNTFEFDIDTLTRGSIGTDCFIYKTDFDGNGIWIRRSYGDDLSSISTVKEDNYGAVYATGYFTASTFTFDAIKDTPSEITLNNQGGKDIMIAKYNKNGNLIWLKSYGGSYDEWAKEIWEKDKFLYIAGYFGYDITIGTSHLTTTGTSNEDALIAIFDTDGNAVRAESVIGYGDEQDVGNTIIMDDQINAYIAGLYKGDSIRIGDSLFINASGLGNKQGFIAKYIPPYSAVFSDVENVTCNGQSDGRLEVTPYFGVAPFQYTWSHDAGLDTSVVTNLAAGPYSVEVKDARDSTTNINITITQPDIIDITLDSTNTSCFNGNDGAIDLSATGGVPSYSYQWTGATGVNPTAQDQSGLVSGWYYVTVIDKNDCEASDSVLVDQPEKINFGGTVVTGSTGLDDGKIDLKVNGGSGMMEDFTYNWTGPNSFTSTEDSISNLEGGNYNLSVEDTNSCPADTAFIVSEAGSFVAYINASTDVTCFGDNNGSASATVLSGSGNYSYEWTDSLGAVISTISSVSGLSGGWYYVQIIDINPPVGPWLYQFDSVFITEATQALQANRAVVNPTCFGDNNGIVDVQVVGGISPYSYLWSNGKTTEDLAGLSYSGDTLYVTVTDDHGCITNNWAYIVNPLLLTAEISLYQSVQCNGSLTGELVVLASGGNSPYTYQWNDPGFQTAPIATELEAGEYIITVTDISGCQEDDTFNLADASFMILDTINSNEVLCYGDASGTLQAQVSGGSGNYNYAWDPPQINSPTLSNLLAGDYELIVTDNICDESDTAYATISAPDTISIVSTDTTHLDCFGDNNGAITVNMTGGTGSYNYSWSHTIQNSATVINLTAGIYNVTISDANINCSTDTEIAEIEIKQPQNLIISDIDSNDVTCNGTNDGNIIITPSGGHKDVNYRYVWSHNPGLDDSTASALSADMYTVTVFDDICSDNVNANIIIEEPDVLSIQNIQSDNISCNGFSDGSIIVTPAGGHKNVNYRYVWSHDAFLDDSIALNLAVDDYTVNVFDDLCGENVNDLISITTPDALDYNILQQTNVQCNGDSLGIIRVQATGGSGNYRFEWTHDPSLDSGYVTNLPAGDYEMFIFDQTCGNSVFETITLTQPDSINIDSVNYTNVANQNDGEIIIYASGGTGILQFALNAGAYSIEYTFTGLITGPYTIQITDDNGCGPITSDEIELITGIPVVKDMIINIFPNPATEFVEISTEKILEKELSVEFMDALGKIVWKGMLKEGSKSLTINIEGFSDGIYFILLGSEKISQPLIINK